MNIKKEIGLILCCMAVLILTGCNTGFSFHIDGTKYTEENMNYFGSEKKQIEELTSLDITTSYADFMVIASDDYYIEYSYYYVTEEPKLSIEDGNLIFDDSKMNQGTYSINQRKPNYMKIYVPSTASFDQVSVNTASGDISLGSFTSKDTTINNSYGDILISSCNLEELNVEVASGKITIEDSTIGEADLDDSYGSVELEDSVVTNLQANLSSGSFRTIACSIEEVSIDNSYGDVKLSLLGKEEDYRISIRSSYGSIQVGDTKYEGKITIDKGGTKEIDISVSSGDIKVTFSE